MSRRSANPSGALAGFFCKLVLCASVSCLDAGPADSSALQFGRELASPINISSPLAQQDEGADSVAIELEEPGAGISFMPPDVEGRPGQAVQIRPIVNKWSASQHSSTQSSLGGDDLRVQPFERCQGRNCTMQWNSSTTSAGLRVEGDLVVAGRVVAPTVDALVGALDETRAELASVKQELAELKGHRMSTSTVRSTGARVNGGRLAWVSQAGAVELDGALYLTGYSSYEADVHPLNNSTKLSANSTLAIEGASWTAIAYKERAFFSARTMATGNELWSWSASQGLRLAQDLFPGPASSSPQHLTVTSGGLFFVATSGRVGRELWHWDDTFEMAVVVSDSIRSGELSSSPAQLVASESELFFVASDRSTWGRVYRYSWLTRDAATVIGSSLPGVSSSTNWNANNLMMVGTDLVFTGTVPSYSRVPFLFNTTTRLISQICPSPCSTVHSASQFVQSMGSYLLFHGSSSTGNRDLWRFDVKRGALSNFGFSASSSVSSLVALGPNVFLAAWMGSSWELVRCTTSQSECGRMSIKHEADSATLTSPQLLTQLGSTLFLVATTAGTGRALFCVTDADSSSTTIVAKLVPGTAYSSPGWLQVDAGRLLFRSNLANGQAAWWSVNSTGGDLRQQTKAFPSGFATFFLFDGASSVLLTWPFALGSLWKYTPDEGLEQLPHDPQLEPHYIDASSIAVLGGEVIMLDPWQWSNQCHGQALWAYSPRDSRGLRLAACDQFHAENPRPLVVYEDWVYMSMYAESAGHELHRMRGSTKPVLVSDIVPGTGSSRAYPVAVYDGSLFVFAQHSVASPFRLWSVSHQPGDSFAPPSVKLVASTEFSSTITVSAAVADTGLVFCHRTAAVGWELFLYSRIGGLERLEALGPDAASSSPSQLALLGNSVILAASTESNVWRLCMMEPGGGVTDVGNRHFLSTAETHSAVVSLGDRVLLLTRQVDWGSQGRLWEAQFGQPMRLASNLGRLRPGVTSVNAVFPFNGTAVALVAAEGVGMSMELLQQ
jgi:ELWxxDGT repeat protein